MPYGSFTIRSDKGNDNAIIVATLTSVNGIHFDTSVPAKSPLKNLQLSMIHGQNADLSGTCAS
jgi:hypothetical protein